MASLIIIDNTTHSTKPYPLGRRPLVIGRAENLPIQVLDDQVSRKHLKIGYDKGTKRYFVWDMHSRNGVYLNDMKVSMETALLRVIGYESDKLTCYLQSKTPMMWKHLSINTRNAESVKNKPMYATDAPGYQQMDKYCAKR